MSDVADGLRPVYKGFKCLRGDGNVKKVVKNRDHLRGPGCVASKRYIITFPDGHEEVVLSLRAFCLKYGLIYHSLWQTILGKTSKSNHRGFKVKTKL